MKEVIKLKITDLYVENIHRGEPENNSVFTKYCRKLIKEGKDPNTRLELYRNREEPDIIIKNIGEAAKITCLENKKEGPRFVKYREKPLSLYRKSGQETLPA